MECFIHHGLQSAAICKICNKGLCRDCCQFASKSYVCSDTCAEEERKYEQVANWSFKYVGSGRKGSLITRQYAYIAMALILFGLAILGPIAYDYFVNQTPIYPPLLLLGIAMLICAFLAYRSKPQ